MKRELTPGNGDQTIVPEERNGPLNPVEQALKRAYTNLVDWHEFLVEQNRDILKRGGVLPVRVNGRTIPYEVSTNLGGYGGTNYLDEAAASVNFKTTDPKRASHPKEIGLHYQKDRVGEVAGLLGVRTLWDHESGLIGESIICSNGRITHILKVGTNNLYYSNPDLEGTRVAFEGDIVYGSHGRYISQGMAIQFTYDGTGNLEHHYARLGNWDSTLFLYVDGEPWDHKTPLPNFPYQFNTIYSIGEIGRYVSFYIFQGFTPDLSAYTKKSDDGQKFTLESPIEFPDSHRFLKDYKGRKYKLTLEAPLIFDPLPHIQQTFPATFEGVTPLLSGPYNRLLRLQTESPSSAAQAYLVRFIQSITSPGSAWKGVTTEQIREAHQFLTRPDILSAMLQGVSEPNRTLGSVYELIPRLITIGYQVEIVKAIIGKLFESGVFQELTKTSQVVDLNEKDLKWVLKEVLLGQTGLIAQPQKKDRLGDARQRLGRFVNRSIYRWGIR